MSTTTTETTVKQPAAKRTSSRASKAAAKAQADQQPAAQKDAPKSTPKPEEPNAPSARDKRHHVLSAWIAEAGQLIETWDPAKHDGITKDEAREFLAARAAYCPGGSTASSSRSL